MTNRRQATAEATAEATADPRDLLIAELTERLNALTEQVGSIKRGSETAPDFGAEMRKLDELDGYCLFRCNPTADPERHIPISSLRLPIELDGPVPLDGSAPQKVVDYLALVPDLQAIPMAHAEQLLNSKFPTVKALKESGIITLWDEQCDLREMDPAKAIQTIALTNRSTKLLTFWAKSYHDLPDSVKRRLVQKQEELSAKVTEAPKALFGTSIT